MTDAAIAEVAPSYFERALGPIRVLIDDPDTIEIALNPDGRVWVERAGDAVMSATDHSFTPETARLLATQLCGQASLGLEKPMVSTSFQRRGENWRVQVIAPPVVEGGYAIALRHHVLRNLSLSDLASGGAFAGTRRRADCVSNAENGIKAMFDAGDIESGLSAAVAARWNILVSGGTSTGKTTVARALLNEADPQDRLVTIEDGFELHPHHPNAVALRATATGPNTANALLEASLRMRPDRIVLGELRGVEAWSFLEAVNTGHPGAITTIHANTPDAAFERLALMVLRANLGLRKAEIIDYARSVIDLIVQLERRNGRRELAEVMVLR